MRSTFMGLETSKRGIFVQQSALYTTGHNIANANTEGYSRQRVNMQPTLGYPGIGLNSPKVPGFIGTGVEAQSVQRIRDGFVDKQYRQETNKLGYWESRSQSITQIEDILNEPSEFGLAKSLDEFWKSLQDLNVNPDPDSGARAVVVQRGIAVADSFNYMSNALADIQKNSAQEYGVSLNSINSILEQVASLNYQIKSIEPNGYMPNDLYDARDSLLDELSQYFPIEIENVPSGGNSLAIAEGSINVSIKMKDGTLLKVVNGKDFAQLRNFGTNTESDGVTPTSPDPIEGFYLVSIDNLGNDVFVNNNLQTAGSAIKQDITNVSDQGKYKGIASAYGYVSDNTTTPVTVKGLLPDMMYKLDLMAKSFADEFNNLHADGTDVYGDIGESFFVNKNSNPEDSTNITAANIYVSKELIDDPGKIAASDSSAGSIEEGNGNNALILANMKFKDLGPLGQVSIQTYFQGAIGQLGVDGQQAQRLMTNAGTLQSAVLDRRASISSVSLDEEMTNMITFQQAYNASARMITVVDETLDKIINGMGRVGI